MGIRIGVITVRGPEYHPNRRLSEAARARGHDLHLLHPYRVWPLLAGGRAGLCGGVLEGVPEVVLPRQGATIGDGCLPLIRHLKLMGVRLINDLAAVWLAKHQMLTLQSLAAAGVPVPDSVFVNAPEGLEEAAVRLGGYPVVVKRVSGRQGDGIHLVSGPGAGQGIVTEELKDRRGVLVQRFIPPEGRRDIRVMVIGGAAVAAMELRPRTGDFRANYHLSGESRGLRPDPRLEEIAVRSAGTLGLEIAGVDVIIDRQGRENVLEVNYSPGFQGLEAATGLDVAGLMVEYASRGKSPRPGRARKGAALMKITNLERGARDGRTRASARVVWEDCDQPAREIFIETEEAFGADLSCNPHSFLVGCLLPAMRFGERRIRVPADICPTLGEGLRSAMALIQDWSRGEFGPLKIEAPAHRQAHRAPEPKRAVCFLSGGMDSLAALRLNRLRFPAEHPGLIRDCFLIHGFDIGGVVQRGPKYPVFERARAALGAIAADAGVGLIPVYTNIRHLCDERDLWLNKFFGAVLAAVGHAFDSRFNLAYVPSSYDIPNLAPCGSHPLLDPEYSSYNLRIRHRDHELSRLEKLRIVAGWDVAFQNFRVCLANVEDRLNCGRCEKCLRTMVGLIAIGALHRTRAFVEDDVDLELLSGFNIRIRHREPFYREMLAPLRSQGREDLAGTVEKMLAAGPG